jgi:hypothetical protein
MRWPYDMEERYAAALHAMQSGVKFMMEQGAKETEPKHLRVGVNSAMVEHAALVKLLIEKGVIREDDYLTALTVAMEKGAATYQERVNEILGTNTVTLK